MEKQKIGFIGLGVMGKSMASHIQKAGYQLYLYNRTQSKAKELVEKGAILCSTVAEVGKSADIVFTIVGYPKDVEEVYLSDNGLVSVAHSGQLFCDMTTTKPSLEALISNKLSKKGAAFCDAPVSGGDIGARNATLSFMVGTDEETFKALTPFFSIMGKTITLCGKVSMGQQTKMCNQITIAGTMIGVTEALVYGKKAGLDLTTMVNTISKGAAGCWTLDNLAPRVIKGDFAPGFMIEHFVKDMGIALEEAERMELELPGLKLVYSLYEKLNESGYSKNGTQALVKALENL